MAQYAPALRRRTTLVLQGRRLKAFDRADARALIHHKRIGRTTKLPVPSGPGSAQKTTRIDDFSTIRMTNRRQRRLLISAESAVPGSAVTHLRHANSFQIALLCMTFLEGEQFAVIPFESGIPFLHIYSATMARPRQRPNCRMPGTNTRLRHKLAGKIEPC